MNNKEPQREEKRQAQQMIVSNYKCWLGYLLIAFWVVSVGCGIILLYDSYTENSVIGSHSRYALQEMKQETFSELKEIDAIPEAVIEGFWLTGNLTLEAEESLKSLDNSSAEKIKKLITSYAIASAVSDLKTARMAARWTFAAFVCTILSTPGFIVSMKYRRFI